MRLVRRLFTTTNETFCRIMEVGPRDGLQNEKQVVSFEQKVKLIEMLGEAGLKDIEAGAFVSPKWVPQMASSAQVIQQILKNKKLANIDISALVPNIKGLKDAMAAGLKTVAVFTTVSETFSRKNTNCTINESLERIQDIVKGKEDVKVRAYVSCVVGCPYEGRTDPGRVRELTQRLLEMGCYQVSLGDTIGIATPGDIRTLLKGFSRVDQLAGHFHDTFGMGLANVLTSVDMGLRTVDTSVAGLGGCPYAPGAAGNVATEEVVYLLEGLGLRTGVDLQKLLEAGEYISSIVQSNPTKLSKALSKKKD